VVSGDVSTARSVGDLADWLRGVSDDKKLVHHRFILMWLGLHQGEARSYQAIADAIGVDRSTVKRAVFAGIKRGWLSSPTSRGRVPNDFDFTFPHTYSNASTGSWGFSNDLSDAAKHAPADPQSNQENQAQHDRSATGSPMTRLIGSMKGEAPAATGAMLPVPEANPFDLFWSIYPKRVDKRVARREFERAIGRGVAVGDILDGARRYAKQRHHQDPRYTKQPANWLRDDRCYDEADEAFRPQKGRRELTAGEIIWQSVGMLQDADGNWYDPDETGGGQ